MGRRRVSYGEVVGRVDGLGWRSMAWVGLMGFVTRKEDLQGSCGDASRRFLVDDEEDIFIVKLSDPVSRRR